MDVLGERPVWSMSGGEMLSDLDVVNAEIARLTTRGLYLIAGLDATGYASEIGAHDTARLLAARYRLDPIEAHRDVRVARALPKYPAVAAALPDTAPPPRTDHPTTPAAAADAGAVEDAAAAGDVGAVEDVGVAEDVAEAAEVAGSAEDAGDADGAGGRALHPAQAQAIVLSLERVAARVPGGHLAVAAEQLVHLAAHLPPAQLRKAGKEITDLLDSDGPGPDEDRAYARESLTLANADNGVKFRGFLANENAELLRALTHAGARPHKTLDGELDPRPREKRQADALTTALTIAATATGHTPPAAAATTAGTATGSPAAPGMSATGTAATGTAATDAAATATTGTGAAVGGGTAGWVPGFGAKANITVTIDFNDLKAATADATGQLVYGDALSAAAIRRLACDATIIPLVLGTNSEPLDVGRSERLVNRAMRRALNARDKGCVVCAAPPIQCDAHHVRSWIDGGPTAITNLVLLCRRHHIDLHAGHWTITITNGTVHVSRPTWANPPHTPRAGPQPPRVHPPTTPPPPTTNTTPRPDPDDDPNPHGVPDRDGVPDPDAGARREAARLECWGEEAPAVPPASRSINRWPDDATREEAARFAVWGDPARTTEPIGASPPPGR